jgi:hypothetical protein
VAAPAPECKADTECGSGKRCIAEHCACECADNRDCRSGFACDGCSCHPSPSPSGRTSVHDAYVTTGVDILNLAGIEDVEGRLTLTGGQLTSTKGLESLRSVGELYFQSAYALGNEPPGSDPLVGFANLTLIRGDLNIGQAQIAKLSFNPSLVIKGNVTIFYAQIDCEEAYRFETTLAAHGFTGTFTAQQNYPACPNTCTAGQCVL